eukprot:46477-Eustigmatos_ZCMA.PRE.1
MPLSRAAGKPCKPRSASADLTRPSRRRHKGCHDHFLSSPIPLAKSHPPHHAAGWRFTTCGHQWSRRAGNRHGRRSSRAARCGRQRL